MNAKAIGFEVYNFNGTLLFILAIIMISAFTKLSVELSFLEMQSLLYTMGSLS
jgi:hypothetical protein